MESIVVIVGPIASGKGTLTTMFINKGYSHLQYGDEVRKEVFNRGLQDDRNTMQDISDLLRLESGNDFFAKKIGQTIEALKKSGNQQNVVIEGLRHPDEVKWMKDNLGAYVIGIVASSEERFRRVKIRGRISDPNTYDGFKVAEERDRGINQPEHGNHVEACLLLADVIINNDSGLEKLVEQFERIYSKSVIEGRGRTKEGL